MFIFKTSKFHVNIFKMSQKLLKRKMEQDSANAAGDMKKKAPGFWSQGLKESMQNPELKVEEDDTIVIIKDKYPKARYHFLVIPRENIASLKCLKKDHLPLLRHMKCKADSLVEGLSTTLKFRFGYHAVPSMSQIHLHVISEDFDSVCLKTKKHWNSFTTDYFVRSDDLIAKLESTGSASFDKSKYESLLKEPLQCHVCKKELQTMPALKKHILDHVPSSAS